VRDLDRLKSTEFTCPPTADSMTSIAPAKDGTLGSTSIDKSSDKKDLMCVPSFDVDAKAGSCTLRSVSVKLSTTSRFAKPEAEAPLGLSMKLPGCGEKEVPIFMTITSPVSSLAQVAEQEHCDDLTLAFKQTLEPCSAELNKFAGQKFAGKDEDECLKGWLLRWGSIHSIAQKSSSR